MCLEEEMSIENNRPMTFYEEIDTGKKNALVAGGYAKNYDGLKCEEKPFVKNEVKDELGVKEEFVKHSSCRSDNKDLKRDKEIQAAGTRKVFKIRKKEIVKACVSSKISQMLKKNEGLPAKPLRTSGVRTIVRSELKDEEDFSLDVGSGKTGTGGIARAVKKRAAASSQCSKAKRAVLNGGKQQKANKVKGAQLVRASKRRNAYLNGEFGGFVNCDSDDDVTDVEGGGQSPGEVYLAECKRSADAFDRMPKDRKVAKIFEHLASSAVRR